MEPMVIEVHEVPHTPSHDRMVDHLKIHFLKRRNSGGDVLTVIYPTSTPGQAYVIFESAKVPGVLERTHILDVNNRFFPIRVKKAHLSEVDMPVETTLNLNVFPKPESVLELLKSYDFTVTEPIPGHLRLKGSFLKLKLIRSQFIQLQGHEHHSSRSPSALHNGSSLGYDLDARFVSMSVSGNMDEMGAVGQHPLLEGAPSSPSYRVSGSGGSPRSFHSNYYSSNGRTSRTADTMQHRTSSNDSASGGSLRRRPSFSGDTWTGSFHSSPSSSGGGMESFPVDTDIINFILTQQQNHVEVIEKACGTEMKVQDNGGLTTVTFSGKNSKKAKAYLLGIVTELSCSLRTQEINLKEFDRAEQKQILERIQRNQDSGVMIIHRDDFIKLVGSSSESFEMKQKILGHEVDPQRGRAKERGSKCRSSSLPRQYKMNHAHITGPENQASAATKYTPSKYQEKPDEGEAPQIVQGPELTSQRTRSNSKSQDKNRTTREQAVHQGLELPSSSEGKKSPKNPAARLRKLIDSNVTNIHFKILPHKKDLYPRKQNQD